MLDLSNKKFPLRVIFWGYHWSGWKTYDRLKQSDVLKVVGIVLPSNREHETILKMMEDAQATGIPFFQPNNLNDENFIGEIKKLAPDVHFVDSYSKLIPKKIIDLAMVGFNLHPGLLPQDRGAHVLNWVLVNGEKETGLSLHVLTDKFDEGAVICLAKTEILITDTAADLDKKLIDKISELIQLLEMQIKNGKIEFQKQVGKEHHYPARTPKDGEIDITESALSAHNKIRAVSYPWSGAFFIINKIKLIVWEAMVLEKKTKLVPGTLIEKDSELYYVGSDRKLLHIKAINSIGNEEYRPMKGKPAIENLKQHGFTITSDELV